MVKFMEIFYQKKKKKVDEIILKTVCPESCLFGGKDPKCYSNRAPFLMINIKKSYNN